MCGGMHVEDLLRPDDGPPLVPPLQMSLTWSEQMTALEALRRQFSVHLPRGFSFLVQESAKDSLHCTQSDATQPQRRSESQTGLCTQSTSLASIRSSIVCAPVNAVTTSLGNGSGSPTAVKPVPLAHIRQSSNALPDNHPNGTASAGLAWSAVPMHRVPQLHHARVHTASHSVAAPVQTDMSPGDGHTQSALRCLDALQSAGTDTGTNRWCVWWPQPLGLLGL